MKKIIIYNSTIATSILSAAIARSRFPEAAVLDITKDSVITDGYDEVLVMVDDLPEINYKDSKVKYIAPQKKGGKRRLIMLWDKLFPGVTRPLVVHYMGRFQLSETKAHIPKHLANGIVAKAGSLEALPFAMVWRGLFANNTALLNSIVEAGENISEYKEATGPEEVAESPMRKEVDKILKENDDLSEKVLNSELKNKGLSEELAWFKKKFVGPELWIKFSKKELKEKLTTKAMKSYFTETKTKGYSKLNEDGLVELLFKTLRNK